MLQASYEQPSTLNSGENPQQQQRSNARPPLEHRHSHAGPLRQEPEPAPIIERPDSAPGDIQVNNTVRADSLVSTESTELSLASNPLSSTSSAPAPQGTVVKNEEDVNQIELKEEEDDDEDDDDDMLDAEEGSAPLTAAERRAERRKMKRFR